MWIMSLLGAQVPLQDGFGAYFWWSLSVVDAFVAILSRFSARFTYFCFFLRFSFQKSLVLIENVVIFESFRAFYFK